MTMVMEDEALVAATASPGAGAGRSARTAARPIRNTGPWLDPARHRQRSVSTRSAGTSARLERLRPSRLRIASAAGVGTSSSPSLPSSPSSPPWWSAQHGRVDTLACQHPLLVAMLASLADALCRIAAAVYAVEACLFIIVPPVAVFHAALPYLSVLYDGDVPITRSMYALYSESPSLAAIHASSTSLAIQVGLTILIPSSSRAGPARKRIFLLLLTTALLTGQHAASIVSDDALGIMPSVLLIIALLGCATGSQVLKETSTAARDGVVCGLACLLGASPLPRLYLFTVLPVAAAFSTTAFWAAWDAMLILSPVLTLALAIGTRPDSLFPSWFALLTHGILLPAVIKDIEISPQAEDADSPTMQTSSGWKAGRTPSQQQRHRASVSYVLQRNP